jgi:hypothetical protein
MPGTQAEWIVGAIVAGFIAYLSIKGKLPRYWAFLTGGGGAAVAASGGTGGAPIPALSDVFQKAIGGATGASSSGSSGSSGSSSSGSSSSGSLKLPTLPAIGAGIFDFVG